MTRLGANAHRQSLRHHLAQLQAADALHIVRETVDLEFELAAYLCLLPSDRAVLFDAVRGHSTKVVASLLTSRERIASSLGVAPTGLQRKIVDAIAAPIAPRLVTDAPVQEITLKAPDLVRLPVPTFFSGEAGPYITAGVIVAKDPVTGRGNMSIARLKPLGGSRSFIGIAPNHHLAVLLRRAEERGETLPIAVTLGHHPAVLLAAVLYLGLGDDELHVAGALLGEPIEVVRCRGVDLAVPAHCEIVLEGHIDAGNTVEEGAVSEFHGMYERYGVGQVATFDLLTQRRDAMFQVIQPGYHAEHVWIGGVAIAAGLARRIAQSVPSVGEVAVTPGGAGRLHAVVCLNNPRPGDAKRAMFAVWAAVSLIKQVTVVDVDVDPWDPVRVEWALATRMRAERDLLVVPDVRADRAEPLERGGLVGKLGIDATRKAGDRADWTEALPPPDVMERVRRRLDERR
jgi:4-hydroxy-3-polyprenylbenzoate decarboxylase